MTAELRLGLEKLIVRSSVLGLFLVGGLVAVETAWAEDCNRAGASYFSAASSLNKDARTVGRDATERLVRNESGSQELFRDAKEKRQEADRLRRFGYKEKQDCWKRKKLALEEKRKKKRSLWDEAREPLKDILDKAQSAKQTAEKLDALRTARGDYRKQLSIVSDLSQDLNASLPARSASPAANQLSRELTEAAIKDIEKTATKAIGEFNEAFENFKKFGYVPEPKKTEPPKTTTSQTDEAESESAESQPAPPPQEERPQVTSRESEDAEEDEGYKCKAGTHTAICNGAEHCYEGPKGPLPPGCRWK